MADKTPLAIHFVEALPDAAARVLEAHPPDEVSGFVDRIPDPLSSKALASMLPYHAARCIASLSDEAAGRYLKTLQPQAVAAILRHSTADRRSRLLGALPRGFSVRVGLLLNHSIRTVGAWMDPSPPALAHTLTAADALARLREHDGRRLPELYVVDENERLLGILALADLVWAEPDSEISRLADPVAHKLAARTTLVTASRHLGWDKAERLPVVDRTGRLIGILRYAALRAGLKHELETAPGPVATGDSLDLTNLWYQGLAGTLNAALAHADNEADPAGAG